ncbi:unnamed protein product (mitochondrion) [Plasmodiophora brassicae]|uniref:HhH-GPD domain-containing protein n=1 Tax=Plasmodiophora brassicae TaxID=37360 RepID=A0A0G4IWZ9_PLABS|nr:hypothetical protein PBRA_007584 [Plasmodiophora brassicae]SPR02062.1 unnamed protein product [Plasmodiophora brassicae]
MVARKRAPGGADVEEPRKVRKVSRVIYTVGHSTVPVEEFVESLTANAVATVVDIRSYPSSRKHPQFGQEALANTLEAHGIAYEWLKGLGGRRKLPPEAERHSDTEGWTHPAFRGYAEYMRTDAFADALTRLEAIAESGRTAIMCAEACWWRCHRRMVSDALLNAGWDVEHIMARGRTKQHVLTPFAQTTNGIVTYPPS